MATSTVTRTDLIKALNQEVGLATKRVRGPSGGCPGDDRRLLGGR